MRVAFLGTAHFSVPTLDALVAAGHDVAVVVTQPDRPGDRGRPASRPVADAAERLGLSVQRPERLRSPDAAAALLAAHPQALVVAAYGQILPGSLLDAVPLGGINVHASLLPRWRGAAPINAAIRAGDAETGVAIMRMEAGLDTGPVFAVARTAIGPRETAPELGERLARLGADRLVEVLAGLDAGTQADPVPQDPDLATYAPRLTREDGRVDWTALDAAGVDRLVRALLPWPGTTAPLAGESVRLLAGEAVAGARGPEPAAPGTITALPDGGLAVVCRAGGYRVELLQPAGRRPMDPASWLRGRRLTVPVPPSA